MTPYLLRVSPCISSRRREFAAYSTSASGLGNLQEVALESQRHGNFRLRDDGTGLCDIDLQNRLPSNLLRVRFRSKGSDQPFDIMLATVCCMRLGALLPASVQVGVGATYQMVATPYLRLVKTARG